MYRVLQSDDFEKVIIREGINLDSDQIGHLLPGDIVELILRPGQKYYVAPGSFLASTPNIKMSTKFGGLRGFFMNHTFLTKVSNVGTGNGVVFISCLGTSQIINVKAQIKDIQKDKLEAKKMANINRKKFLNISSQEKFKDTSTSIFEWE